MPFGTIDIVETLASTLKLAVTCNFFVNLKDAVGTKFTMVDMLRFDSKISTFDHTNCHTPIEEVD